MSAMYRACLAVGLSLLSFCAYGAVGFDDLFSARSGDLNGDGRTDVYLKWTPKIVMIELDDLAIPIPTTRRDVPDFVLQQTPSGTFTLVSGLTAAQLSTVGGWPRVSDSVKLVAGDLNFDGKVDLVIRNLAAAIAGVDPQLVIASTTPGAAPTNVVPLNATMQDFYREVGKWFLSPEVTEVLYYLQWVYAGYSSYYDPFFCLGFVECQFFVDDVDDPQGTWPGDDPFTPNVYHYWGAHLITQTITYRDYELPNSTHFQFADALYDTEPAGEIPASGSIANTLQNVLNTIWGQPVVILNQVPPEGVEPQLEDNWRWTTITKKLLRVLFEVCVDDGDTVADCWVDIASPGHPRQHTCSALNPFEPGAAFFDYSITVAQRAMDSSNQRQPFWVSRYNDSCDPFAPAALGVVDERGLGLVTMKWLRAIAAHKGITVDETQLGYEIMHAHVDTTDEDFTSVPHLLSKQQITDYHQAVFSNLGFPDYTFGGAPYGDDTWGGRQFMDFLGAAFWCPDCDKLP